MPVRKGRGPGPQKIWSICGCIPTFFLKILLHIHEQGTYDHCPVVLGSFFWCSFVYIYVEHGPHIPVNWS